MYKNFIISINPTYLNLSIQFSIKKDILVDVGKTVVNENWRKGEEAWLDVWGRERRKQEDDDVISNAQVQVNKTIKFSD